MASNNICFYQSTYAKYQARVALRQAPSGNYLGICLSKDIFCESTQEIKQMEKSVFVYADAMLALGCKLKEISDSIDEAVIKFQANKENLGDKFQTLYQNIFHERSKTQYRVEMVAKGTLPPLFGVAQFYVPDGGLDWAPSKFSVFMPKYMWNRFYQTLPEIISALSDVMKAGMGARSFCLLLFIVTFFF